MATSKLSYLGNLRTELTHLQSGSKVITDAPVDNHGRGEAFSPTDIVASALASCMMTILGIVAREHGFSIDGSHADVTKVMSANPRRISEVHVSLFFPGNEYSAKQKTIIKRAAETCPVALSLHPDIKQVLKFCFEK